MYRAVTDRFAQHVAESLQLVPDTPKVAAPVSTCRTMSTSRVGRVSCNPAYAAWSCTISPPTSVH